MTTRAWLTWTSPALDSALVNLPFGEQKALVARSLAWFFSIAELESPLLAKTVTAAGIPVPGDSVQKDPAVGTC